MANFTCKTQVVDASSQAPISGVMVYVNSVNQGTTDSQGNVTISAPIGSVNVTVRGNGYSSSFSATVSDSAGTGFPSRLPSSIPTAQKQILTFVVGSPANSSLHLLLANGTSLETLICNGGQATTSGSYAPGQYQVVASVSGYASATTFITVVAGIPQYSVNPPIQQNPSSDVSSSDVQKTAGAGTAVGTTASTVALAATAVSSPAPDYEWIYPNSEDGKYFTSTQARIFIGNLFLDELVSVQFTFQGNRIPIFGYSSRLADAFGTGRALVQGQLAINFVTEGYLYVVLQEFQKMAAGGVLSSAQQTNIAKLNAATQQYSVVAAQKVQTPTQAASQQAQLTATSGQIQSLANALGPQGLDLYKASQTSATVGKSPILADIPFNIQFQFQGAGRTVTRTITNCLLVSNDQVLDQSGCTLLDAYGFVGRSVI